MAIIVFFRVLVSHYNGNANVGIRFQMTEVFVFNAIEKDLSGYNFIFGWFSGEES